MDEYFDDRAVVFLEDDDFDNSGKFVHKLNNRPLIVMMGGSFCPHCRHAAPAFNAFAKAMRKSNQAVPAVIQVDKSENEGRLGSRLGSMFPDAGRGVPCYLMFSPSGQFVKTHEGPRTQEALEKFARGE
jgi:thiol-disulfide isomerase/thioredoxin